MSESHPTHPTLVYVALGSNLGDRVAHLRAGVEALSAHALAELSALSPVFETVPVGGPTQGDYLNAVLALEWSGSARGLLQSLLQIEAEQGRARSEERNAPRTLDLDLLLFGEEQIVEADLEVPHPRMASRAFVLEPLRLLAAELVHPVLHETISALARQAPAAGQVRFFADPALLYR